MNDATSDTNDNDKQRVVQLMATGDTANENSELKRVITSGTTNYN